MELGDTRRWGGVSRDYSESVVVLSDPVVRRKRAVPGPRERRGFAERKHAAVRFCERPRSDAAGTFYSDPYWSVPNRGHRISRRIGDCEVRASPSGGLCASDESGSRVRAMVWDEHQRQLPASERRSPGKLLQCESAAPVGDARKRQGGLRSVSAVRVLPALSARQIDFCSEFREPELCGLL